MSNWKYSIEFLYLTLSFQYVQILIYYFDEIFNRFIIDEKLNRLKLILIQVEVRFFVIDTISF
ncbi:hypothetical protein AK965_15395 [Vibrio sp. PID17_43]|nr:hypothetical protein AK965_15395 [Vibrio sp. PID17_43]